MAKWTTESIPSQAGRVAVITGANTGLGYETARALAAAGARVVLAVRNPDKGANASRRIEREVPGAEISVQQLDLASLDSVRAAAERLRADHPRIDLLVNNAGVYLPPRAATTDGFELQFGTNHLGHFALTGLLVESMVPVPGSRIVTLSSPGHRIRAAIHFDDLQWERSYSRLGAYGQSKLANLLFTYHLQGLLAPHQTTIAVAAHPGGSKTDLYDGLPPLIAAAHAIGKPMMQSAAMGALPTLRAATDPNVCGGDYYGPGGLGEVRGYPKKVASSAQSHDVELQRRLWEKSEELTGVEYWL
ncbi:SDR family NAD(P)-dependent oxidoreductase [Mycobacterium sp. NPDC003449]